MTIEISRATKHKATGDYVCVVLQETLARKALVALTKRLGTKRAAVEHALVVAARLSRGKPAAD